MKMCFLIYFTIPIGRYGDKEWDVTLLFLLTRGGVLVAKCLWFALGSHGDKDCCSITN